MNRLSSVLVPLALAAAPLLANTGDSLVPCPARAVSPHIAYGGGWSTTIYLTFTFPFEETSVTLRFFDNAGKPIQAPISGVAGRMSEVQLRVPPGGEAIELLGTDTQTSVGWISATCTGNAYLQMFEVFRHSAPGRPDFEASVPFSLIRRSNGNPPNVRFIEFPFDNRNGLETGVAIVNAGESAGIGLTCYAGTQEYGKRDYLLDRSTVYGAWVLSALFPATSGKMGVCRVYGILGTDPRPVAIALRFTPGGAFSTLPAATD